MLCARCCLGSFANLCSALKNAKEDGQAEKEVSSLLNQNIGPISCHYVTSLHNRAAQNDTSYFHFEASLGCTCISSLLWASRSRAVGFLAIFQVLWQIIWQQAGNQRARLYICSNEEQGLGFRAFNKCELQVRRYKSLTNVVVHKRWIVKLQMSTLIKANVH